MAKYVFTNYLTSYGWYANHAKTSGVSRIRAMLFQNTTPPTVANIRAVSTVDAAIDLGLDEANFSGYSAGGKILAPGDITITTNTGTRTQEVSFPNQLIWTPAGGAIDNTMFCCIMAYQPDSGTNDYNLWLPLGLGTGATGDAAGGDYKYTFGNLPTTAPA